MATDHRDLHCAMRLVARRRSCGRTTTTCSVNGVYVKANGQTLFVAKEDSVILSLLRRLIGPLFGLLRTNFIILRGESDDVVGEFNRKLTILDRYVLDMRADTGKSLDRRVALALGVMLDTGERR